MLGDFVRDKDAVTASLLLAEMAAWYFSKNMTLIDALEAIFSKYGYHAERTMNLVMPGLDGLAKMSALMRTLRSEPPRAISDVAVLRVRDYESGVLTDISDGKTSPLELRGSNVLRFDLADGAGIIVRPSGTEPKIKVYILAAGTSRDECDAQIAKYAGWAESLN
jgi:phosphoglucomutase